MSVITNKNPATRWKTPEAILFLLGWITVSLSWALYTQKEAGMPGEAIPIGTLMLAVFLCMVTPRTTWKIWKRVLFVVAAYFGVSLLGIMAMFLVITPLMYFGAKESVGPVGNTLAGTLFLIIAMRQSSMFRAFETIDEPKIEGIPDTLPATTMSQDNIGSASVPESINKLLYGIGAEGVLQMEEFVRPLVESGTSKLPVANARAGCLVHSFALVWTGISLKVPVEVGKPHMDGVVDQLAKDIKEFGFDWSREEIEASVGRTWYELVNLPAHDAGQKSFRMSNHLLSYYLGEDQMGIDSSLKLGMVIRKIVGRAQIILEETAELV